MDPNKSLYLKIGGAVLALGFVFFMAVYVVPRALVTMTKAAPASVVSLSDSTMIGERLLARADGKDECVVDVYVLDKSSKGVAKKMVILEGLEDISPTNMLTDKDGKAKFVIKSTKEGTFPISANVEGATLSKIIKVTFRN